MIHGTGNQSEGQNEPRINSNIFRLSSFDALLHAASGTENDTHRNHNPPMADRRPISTVPYISLRKTFNLRIASTALLEAC